MSSGRSHLLPHEILLYACAATEADEPTRRRLDAALDRPDLDWPALIRQSVRHGLTPCVGFHLRGFANDPRIPPAAAACLERMSQGNAHRNQVLFRETARLLRALDAVGIRCLVLKGVALALTVYPDPALRNFADIDILVESGQRDAAEAVVAACGFVKEAASPDGVPHHATFLASCPEDILTDTLAPEFNPIVTPDILARHRHQIVLEVHDGLFRDAARRTRQFDMAAFWERPLTTSLPDGTPLRAPAPEVMLAHLALHAASHLYRRLIFPLDMALTIRHYGASLDWNRVEALADRFAVREEAYRMLEFVQRTFAADVPAGTLQRLQPQGGQRRPEPPLTLAAVFTAMQMDPGAQSWHLLLRSDGARAFLISAWRTLLPSRLVMQRVYGVRSPFLIALLYLIRPFHLTLRLAKVLSRQARPPRRTAPVKEEGGQPHLLTTDKTQQPTRRNHR